MGVLLEVFVRPFSNRWFFGKWWHRREESHKFKHSDRKQESCYQEWGMACDCPVGRDFYLGWTGSSNGQWWQLCVLVAQSCLTLCNPLDCSPPGSPVPGILQARILEWVAIPFSRGSSWPRDWTCISWTAGRFFMIWATRDYKCKHYSLYTLKWLKW